METTPAARIDLRDPSLYFNRELSLIEFHERVLAQAKDPAVPTLERLRFLTICSAILDEFFEIRVSGVKEKIAHDVDDVGPDGIAPRELLARISERCHALVSEQYRVLNEVVLPALQQAGIRLLRRGELSPAVRAWVTEYFAREVLPVLTPIRLDPAHPFPRVVNKALNFVVSVKGRDAFGRPAQAAVLQAPRVLPRVIAVPEEVSGSRYDFVLLSSVIHDNIGTLFPGMEVTGCYQFRVTRNSDLWVDEEEADDLLFALKGQLPRRNYGDAVRLEVADNCPREMWEFLMEQFELQEEDVYQVNGPVNLHRLEALYGVADRPDLKYPPFVPRRPQGLGPDADVFAVIRERDVLLHHPYESFAPVVELARQAAADPQVLAIKMTVYRTGRDSPIVAALEQAAADGKEVTAVIELRARFDEERNIDLATRLQEAGAKVAYGIVGYKAHAKMLLIVRRERDGLRRYVHLGTGNYHAGTARAYTDLGLMTCDPAIGEDVHRIFQQLTGLGKVSRLDKLFQAPFTLHRRILDLIEAEAEEARAGRPARIVAKMNTLLEAKVIRALYRASQAGVPIDLIVRGVCALRPGVPGVSENIRVRSIVGRFLEHHRVFHFHAGGRQVTLASSADWMPRNFFRRVETCFPIEDEELRRRVVRECLELYLEDTAQAWVLREDGSYERLAERADEPHSAQETLLSMYAR
ncbi:MAG: polyphosphate kinase 1 [Acidobacteriota bacterium]